MLQHRARRLKTAYPSRPRLPEALTMKWHTAQKHWQPSRSHCGLPWKCSPRQEAEKEEAAVSQPGNAVSPWYLWGICSRAHTLLRIIEFVGTPASEELPTAHLRTHRFLDDAGYDRVGQVEVFRPLSHSGHLWRHTIGG